MPANQDTPDMHTQPAAAAPSLRAPAEAGIEMLPPGAIPTDFLFRGTQEILIAHKGEHYRLRITRNGKLILTK